MYLADLREYVPSGGHAFRQFSLMAMQNPRLCKCTPPSLNTAFDHVRCVFSTFFLDTGVLHLTYICFPRTTPGTSFSHCAPHLTVLGSTHAYAVSKHCRRYGLLITLFL